MSQENTHMDSTWFNATARTKYSMLFFSFFGTCCSDRFVVMGTCGGGGGDEADVCGEKKSVIKTWVMNDANGVVSAQCEAGTKKWSDMR